MKNHPITITKRSGKTVPFNPDKLRLSLERSGASEDLILQVMNEVENHLYQGIPTQEIYQKAFFLLRKKARPVAARYNLKKALFELGPTGFPFELFVAKLLKAKGFTTKTGQIVQGHCVQHEVDVVALKDEKHFMVECKFHSNQSRHCDVKIPLYIQSRFKDVEAEWMKKEGHNVKFHQGWVATNTRFTSDAIEYSQCMDLRMLSWDYPFNQAIKDWVNQTGSHPVTVLTRLTRNEKQELLDRKIVLCRQLCENPLVLDRLGLLPPRAGKVLEEARGVCDILR